MKAKKNCTMPAVSRLRIQSVVGKSAFAGRCKGRELTKNIAVRIMLTDYVSIIKAAAV
jgi:hypothetical protein